jgi:CBS domain-containing protein
MKVFDIMSEHIVTVGLGEPVAAAARLLKQYNIGAVPVCDERGNLRGMITDRDIAVRCAANGLSPMETKTGDVMTRGVITINDNAYVGDAARLMADAQIRRLPVCRDGRLVGMLSLAERTSIRASALPPPMFIMATATRKLRKLYVKFLKTSAECSIYHSHCAQILL